MLNRVLVACGLIVSLTSPCLADEVAADSAAAEQAKGVRESFEAYRDALTNGDGEAAAASVSTETIAVYQQYRDLAVSGTEEKLKALSMITRLQVLLIKHRIDPDALKKLDGAGVFGYAVNKQWMGKDAIDRAGLSDIAVEGVRATARVLIDGHPAAESFHFAREMTGWKFDLAPTLKKSDQALQDAAGKRGQTENEFLFSAISSLSGKQVADAIWQPLE